MVSTYVAVASKVLQQLDFAQSALGEDLLAEDIGNLLDGDTLVRLVVDCGATSSARGLASGREGGGVVVVARSRGRARSEIRIRLRDGTEGGRQM